MPTQIEEFYKRIYKKNLQDEERLKRKEEVMERAREYYGYDVDYRDSRYLNFL